MNRRNTITQDNLYLEKNIKMGVQRIFREGGNRYMNAEEIEVVRAERRIFKCNRKGGNEASIQSRCWEHCTDRQDRGDNIFERRKMVGRNGKRVFHYRNVSNMRRKLLNGEFNLN